MAPIAERRTFAYQMYLLARRGLIVEDTAQYQGSHTITGNNTEECRYFNIPSSIRSFCSSILDDLLQSSGYSETVFDRKLFIIHSLIVTLQAQKTISDCTKELNNHLDVWRWAMLAMLEVQSVESCMLVSKLLWVVRKSIRILMKKGEDDSDENPAADRGSKRLGYVSSFPWRKSVDEWSYMAYQPLKSEINHAEASW
eukprot:CAMPEP_0172201184 /NCGR_PEP_ID=MMETSP1050-20130122/29830_1 /TAXON_ID=233186 /ORGANISM="Cryptomonas curvata, Strain CCAP979/52" /LENGTH=197 /DNA_ID=CAMNT_0012878745 /DNA_START=251 /DNA_END=841 /DNA_ORIENTATION=+